MKFYEIYEIYEINILINLEIVLDFKEIILFNEKRINCLKLRKIDLMNKNYNLFTFLIFFKPEISS